MATELGDIKILIDVDVTKFEASLNNAMARANSAFNRMGGSMASSINTTLANGFRQQYQTLSQGLRDTFRTAFAAAEQEQAQSMSRLRSRMTSQMGDVSQMGRIGQSVGSSFAIGFRSPILNAVSAVHGALSGLKDIGSLLGTVTGFTMAANLGGIQSGISSLLRDTKQGAQITTQLQQLAMKTPFQVEDFAGVGRKMLAMGMPGNQLVSTMSTIADAVAATGGGATELRDLSEFIAKVRMNPRAIDTDTLLGLVRSGMPLRAISEEMAGRSFSNEQEATMFLQSRLSGRGAAGINEMLAASDRRFGGSAGAMGQTSLDNVMQRVSESLQSVLMGSSKQGLPVALGGLNMAADVFTRLGQLNEQALGVPGIIVLIGAFNYLRNAFMTAKNNVDQFVVSLNNFSAAVQVFSQKQLGASATPLLLGSGGAGIVPYSNIVGPVTPMDKVRDGIKTKMNNLGINNFLNNVNSSQLGNVLTMGLGAAAMIQYQNIAQEQINNQGNREKLEQGQRVQGMLAMATSGAMLGGMLGTVVPAIGNVVGTLAGGLIGGAIGFFTQTGEEPVQNRALDENTKALNNATFAMTMLASSIIGAGPRASGAVSAIELEMYMASRNNMMNVGIG